jgi:ubiquinone biosynthesis accessory factor UbiJ
MSFALLQTALLLPLELSINGVLALDAASKTRLAKLEGRTLAVYATQPSMTLFVSVRGNKLHLGVIHEGPETASLHGSASALLGLLLRREPVDNLRARNVELRGDTSFVQQLQALLLGLDIDWEYHVSKLVGDIPTQAFATGLRGAGDYLRKTGSRLQQDFSDYVHEEKQWLPTAAELETFYGDIAELQLRVDRLQARIQLLMTNR